VINPDSKQESEQRGEVFEYAIAKWFLHKDGITFGVDFDSISLVGSACSSADIQHFGWRCRDYANLPRERDDQSWRRDDIYRSRTAGQYLRIETGWLDSHN
jgi:hypothetical protein